MAEDYELEVLLSLDGFEFQFAGGYRVKIVRTGPNSAKPEHDYREFHWLCREGVFRYLTGTGCSNETYLAASRRGDF